MVDRTPHGSSTVSIEAEGEWKRVQQHVRAADMDAMNRLCQSCGQPLHSKKCGRCHPAQHKTNAVAWFGIAMMAFAGLGLFAFGFTASPSDGRDSRTTDKPLSVPETPDLPPLEQHRATVMLVGEPVGGDGSSTSKQSCAQGVRGSKWPYAAGDEVLVSQGNMHVDNAELSGGEWEYGVCAFDLKFQALASSTAPEFTFPDGTTFHLQKDGEVGDEGLSIYLR